MTVLVLAWLVMVAGCAHPIGADYTGDEKAYEQLAASALQGEMTPTTKLVLHRTGTDRLYQKDPGEALQVLSEKVCSDSRRDLWFALAELNFLFGGELARSDWHRRIPLAPDRYLFAAVSAWYFLLGEGSEAAPGPFDRRYRIACDLYNRAVAKAFMTGERPDVKVWPTERTAILGKHQFTVRFSQPGFKWDLGLLDRFLPADEFSLRGLTVRDRQAGMGAPLIAVSKLPDPKQFARCIPATLLLRSPTRLADYCSNRLELSLELYDGFGADTVEVANHRIPLERDLTAPLACTLNDDRIWRVGARQFFSSDEWVTNRIYFTQPYVPGKMPVIFVHGTFSSPIWWAEMWNTLNADPVLREKFQFWSFVYNSGNPFTFSGANLRDQINQQVQSLDPDGKDAALRQMVIIGHSQGGLLAKLTAVDTGDRLWQTVTTNAFAATSFRSQTEGEWVRRNFFFTPLPSVKRVVFIATPHRGSYRATSFVRRLARRFMSFPKDAFAATESLLKIRGGSPVPSEVRKSVPTSLDTMSPKSKLLLALADTPVAPGIHSHSIIPVKGSGAPQKSSDGVVKYVSASISGVDSELIVRSGHSCQGMPQTIEEVRRILLIHLDSMVASGDAPALHTATSPSY